MLIHISWGGCLPEKGDKIRDTRAAFPNAVRVKLTREPNIENLLWMCNPPIGGGYVTYPGGMEVKRSSGGGGLEKRFCINGVGGGARQTA